MLATYIALFATSFATVLSSYNTQHSAAADSNNYNMKEDQVMVCCCGSGMTAT